MPQITISNRKIDQAINYGRATMLIDWPVERLGEYGARTFDGSPVTPEATDRAMDRYVSEVVAEHRYVHVASACAGRTAKGRPVIVLTITPRPEFPA